jgi:uncharacterized protein (TIGR03083 family)
MEHREYCDHLATVVDSYATALSDADMAARVPTCPEWSLRELVAHTGRIHRWAIELVQTLSSGFVPAPRDADPGDDASGWLRAGGEELVATLRAADPAASMWAWGTDQRVVFWSRRQLHETVIHEADARIALDLAVDIDRDVAADGIDELLDNLPSAVRFAPTIAELRGDGETIHLHATDTPDADGIGEWLITLVPDGFSYTHGHAKGDVAVRGALADLELLMNNRASLGGGAFEVFGDATVIERWLAAAKL